MLNKQNQNLSEELETVDEGNAPLKGTWFSLAILMAVITATFILMFSIFLDRV